MAREAAIVGKRGCNSRQEAVAVGESLVIDVLGKVLPPLHATHGIAPRLEES